MYGAQLIKAREERRIGSADLMEYTISCGRGIEQSMRKSEVWVRNYVVQVDVYLFDRG